MYDPTMVQPMRDEVTRLGVEELRTPGDVDAALATRQGSVLVFINSVCGCAAGNARPALTLALEHPIKPERLTTVFAGQDPEATARAREYFADYPPSSPQIVLLQDGQVAHMIQRHQIEGRMAEDIAGELRQAFDRHCAARS